MLDVYDGALDLLRRWPQAVAAAQSDAVVGNAQADILLNDYRPIRPYAMQLGEDIERYERRAAARETPGLG
ncbi:hypothetical protein ACFQ68_07385 [Amycolatopsis japonica]|uniref:hypothetical protein n=1 Tax=Amycolatopsis japonica TaxID=208439 RepID=UPI00366ACF32